MDTPLNASSTTAGGLMSNGHFKVPQFQREYAWEKDEVVEFFTDLSQSLQVDTYFLGLVIVTGHGKTKDVVDGQQRLLTLTLLTSALYHQTRQYERRALAERLQSTFLKAIDFETDDESPRLQLSSPSDNETLKQILAHPASDLKTQDDGESVSALLLSAYKLLSDALMADLQEDPFKRLGIWADFLTNKLYFAVFVHPDPASAYRVFEVINTRGRELTTADLLKSYVLSQTPQSQRGDRYDQWQGIASAFNEENANVFVQFIRHAVTTVRGHVLPRDLYDVLTGRGGGTRVPMAPGELIDLLHRQLPVYRQLMDPTVEGPASEGQLAVFAVLAAVNVVSVRPILMAMMDTPNAHEGMTHLLRLVIRRMVVGNLGTGNVERRLGQAALTIVSEHAWEGALESLSDLNPRQNDFSERVHHRSINKNLLTVIRASILQHSITPDPSGYLYQIKPRSGDWNFEDEDRVVYWASTIGNSFLANEPRRPMGSSTWEGFLSHLLQEGVQGEWVDEIESFADWDVEAIVTMGEDLAKVAADVWYA